MSQLHTSKKAGGMRSWPSTLSATRPRPSIRPLSYIPEAVIIGDDDHRRAVIGMADGGAARVTTSDQDRSEDLDSGRHDRALHQHTGHAGR